LVTHTDPTLDAAPTPPLIPLRRWLMAVSMLLLNVMDVVVTKAIIRLGGIEANPIMAPIMDHPSYPLILKTIVALGVGGLLLASPVESKLADRAVFAVIVAYVVVMGWNFGILLQAAGPQAPV
jgi:Domain of unknown function (DUF5658)